MADTIGTLVPESWKIPLFWATVDGSRAGFLTQAQPALIVGHMNVSGSQAGTAALNTPIAIGSPALGQVLFGQGSMLDRMIKAFFAVNVNQLVYAMAIAEPSAGQKAGGIINVTHAATTPGTLFIQIAGQLVQIAVDTTDTLTNIGANLAAAINAAVDLPVVAVATAGSVALTCNWKGLTGNDITIIPNYLGPTGGQVYPPGVAVTITAMSGGTAAPDCTAAISAIMSHPIYYVALPWTDSISLLAWDTEFGMSISGRWGWSRQQYGQIFSAYRNDYADSITFGLGGPNSPVVSIMAIEQLVPSTVWEVAAAYAGIAALGFSDMPARPLQTLELLGIVPATLPNRYTQAEQNNLANSGLAVQMVDTAGNMMVLTEQTTYQTNQYGQGDSAFGLATVLSTLTALLSQMHASITSKFPRSVLVPNGTAYGPSSFIVTPNVIAAELVSEFQLAIFNGLASGLEAFTKNLIVEIDSTNPNRVNVLWPGTLSGQLRIFAVLAQFRLLASPVSIQ